MRSMENAPGPWSKYDKVVVAHAVVGSVAWLIVRFFKCTFKRHN